MTGSHAGGSYPPTVNKLSTSYQHFARHDVDNFVPGTRSYQHPYYYYLYILYSNNNVPRGVVEIGGC